MTERKSQISQTYSRVWAGCSARPTPSGEKACQLFAANLEDHIQFAQEYLDLGFDQLYIVPHVRAKF